LKGQNEGEEPEERKDKTKLIIKMGRRRKKALIRAGPYFVVKKMAVHSLSLRMITWLASLLTRLNLVVLLCVGGGGGKTKIKKTDYFPKQHQRTDLCSGDSVSFL
jgi:hypothetical protein